MIDECEYSVVRGVGLTCKLSLITVTHIFLCNLVSSHLHDSGLYHILYILNVDCVGHGFNLLLQIVRDGVNLIFI